MCRNVVGWWLAGAESERNDKGNPELWYRLGTDTPVLDRVVGREGGRGKHRSPLKVVSNKVC